MQEKLSTQLHVIRDYNHRRSLDKIWARQKDVIFPSFSSVTINFFLTNRINITFIDTLHQKIAKA